MLVADPIKVGGCNTSGAVRCLSLEGSGGILCQKIWESRSWEMSFPALWQIQYLTKINIDLVMTVMTQMKFNIESSRE